MVSFLHSLVVTTVITSLAFPADDLLWEEVLLFVVTQHVVPRRLAVIASIANSAATAAAFILVLYLFDFSRTNGSISLASIEDTSKGSLFPPHQAHSAPNHSEACFSLRFISHLSQPLAARLGS